MLCGHASPERTERRSGAEPGVLKYCVDMLKCCVGMLKCCVDTPPTKQAQKAWERHTLLFPRYKLLLSIRATDKPPHHPAWRYRHHLQEPHNTSTAQPRSKLSSTACHSSCEEIKLTLGMCLQIRSQNCVIKPDVTSSATLTHIWANILVVQSSASQPPDLHWWAATLFSLQVGRLCVALPPLIGWFRTQDTKTIFYPNPYRWCLHYCIHFFLFLRLCCFLFLVVGPWLVWPRVERVFP